MKEIAPQVRKFQVEQLLKRANRALEGKEDASAVFSSLEEFRGDPRVDEKMRELRAKVIETNALQQIESFGKNLKKTRSFANDRVRQVSLLTIQESVLRLIADLELEETAPKGVLKKAEDLLASCDKELLALADKQKEDIAKKVRCYQAWALEQIREFDSPNGWYYDATLPWIREELKKFENASEDKEWLLFQVFPSTKTLIEDELGVKGLSELKGAKLTAEKQKEIYNKAWSYFGWKNDIDIEIAYRATRDGMVKFLLPIQPNLLDPPVYQLYQQAFAKGWQKLEGHNGSWIWDERGEEGKWVRISDQLFVAQQSAVVKKKTLEEVASEYRCK
ncbi:MAG: hypothetical protein KatS3mg105_4203 [Gemmatales bacterium]|nr:MAG: hypothetical protein KatS3mg105_4203 [Gemmatales bacterium]